MKNRPSWQCSFSLQGGTGIWMYRWGWVHLLTNGVVILIGLSMGFRCGWHSWLGKQSAWFVWEDKCYRLSSQRFEHHFVKEEICDRQWNYICWPIADWEGCEARSCQDFGLVRLSCTEGRYFAHMSVHLMVQTAKKNVFQWLEEHQTEFEKIKRLLTSDMVIWGKQHLICVDHWSGFQMFFFFLIFHLLLRLQWSASARFFIQPDHWFDSVLHGGGEIGRCTPRSWLQKKFQQNGALGLHSDAEQARGIGRQHCPGLRVPQGKEHDHHRRPQSALSTTPERQFAGECSWVSDLLHYQAAFNLGLESRSCGWGRWAGGLPFLDDTTLFNAASMDRAVRHCSVARKVETFNDLQLGDDLDELSGRASAIGMKINEWKTQLLVISPPNRCTTVASFTAGEGIVVGSVNKLQLVGFTFGDSPDAGEHVQILVDWYGRKKWMLYHLRNAGFKADQLYKLYACYIRSIIEYCAPVYHSLLNRGQEEQLERLQRHAIRVCNGYKTPVEQHMEAAAISTLKDRRVRRIDKFIWKGRPTQSSSQPPFPS